MEAYVAILFWTVMTFGVFYLADRLPEGRARFWRAATLAYGLPGYAILSFYLASRPAPLATAVGVIFGILFLVFFLWRRSRRRSV